MKKEWFTPAELQGMDGLPKSRQGVNKRAREDGWEKRRRKGVQGRGVEYSLHSLPEALQRSLVMQEQVAGYATPQTDRFAIWAQIYRQLSEQEREALIAHILRVGVTSMLCQLGIRQPDDADTQAPSP